MTTMYNVFPVVIFEMKSKQVLAQLFGGLLLSQMVPVSSFILCLCNNVSLLYNPKSKSPLGPYRTNPFQSPTKDKIAKKFPQKMSKNHQKITPMERRKNVPPQIPAAFRANNGLGRVGMMSAAGTAPTPAAGQDSPIPFNRNNKPAGTANSNGNGRKMSDASGNRKISENSVGSAASKRPLTLASRQSSAEDPQQNGSRTASRKHKLHPAERRAVMLAATPASSDGFKKGPHAFNAFRRLSRAEFPFKRGGDKMHMTSIKKIMEKFERHSTIHGICHAGIAPNNRWRRFWLCVFAICFVILVVQVVYMVLKYFSFPKTVDLDLKFENAPFPSVTFCNLNPYKASAIGEDSKIKATLDAFKDKEKETGHKGGIAASLHLENAAALRRRRRELVRKAHMEGFERRYLQVYAQCYCEINRLSAERKRGSCFAAYKGKVSLSFAAGSQLHNFHPTKCLCQLDWITKTLWPCFPYNTWKEHICTECVDQLGHCPMRFYSYHMVDGNGNGNGKNGKNTGKRATSPKTAPKTGRRAKNETSKASSKKDQKQLQSTPPPVPKPKDRIRKIETLDSDLDVCICHREYNHCVQNNINGEIPEILPSSDLEGMNFTESFVDSRGLDPRAFGLAVSTTTTTTQAPEVVEAMGYEELEDEIAIRNKAQENLRFAMGEKPVDERQNMSQTKDELILKCSFNQRDCDIENDFKQVFDPTYGNCYTFNWDRNANVTAHRAGANYGLKVMLYANVSEYLSISEAVGFRITVHDKWTVPFADAFGYNAPTGFMSSFGVRMKKFFRLEPPYGHCSEAAAVSNSYIYKGYSYSIEGCHRSCTQHEIIKICGCADPLYPVPNSAHACPVSDPDARKCIDNATREISDLISSDKLVDCQCPQPCRETAYEVTYSAARWPSGTTNVMECKSADDLCMEKYRTNAAMIQVFYEELNYETLSENPAYGLTNLIADLGGLTGLWIGISVVSILEVFQLIWFCLDFYRTKKLQQNSMKKHSLTPLSSESVKSSKKAPSLSSKSLKSLKGSLKGSVPDDIAPPITLIIEEESGSGNSTPRTKRSVTTLAPGDDLPCTCLYGSRGQIVFMKPLCPFHGYMVRRCSEMYSSADERGDGSEEEEEDGDEEEENGGGGGEDQADPIPGPGGITGEERRVLEAQVGDGGIGGRRSTRRKKGPKNGEDGEGGGRGEADEDG